VTDANDEATQFITYYADAAKFWSRCAKLHLMDRNLEEAAQAQREAARYAKAAIKRRLILVNEGREA
jgi:hypothetical protein